ncbi:MAG: helix-turn-helix transcriptional regulator [Dehalococcoidia bacterium]|nr:MAG: LuxR family transcriptional regulator [bacterium]MCE7928020.1 LuxR family transcriptional regulator [Chloroflexi bacterium CFX7]NUQ55116.1 helix-turn-helix transcriptional regulator [Dehalococcoidia bacterium]RIL03777.1 MAG: hypothetical protein DCC78_03220 [bacterium]
MRSYHSRREGRLNARGGHGAIAWDLIGSQVADAFLEAGGTRVENVHASLTPAEREVLRLLLNGGLVREIARELVISDHTARTHVRNIHGKTSTHSLSQLVSWGHHHKACCLFGRQDTANKVFSGPD